MNFSRLPILDRPRVALSRAHRELRAWASPLINPFLAQARRVDARGARWLFTLVFIVIIWLAAMGAALAWASETGHPRDWADTGALLWIGIVWVVAWFVERVRDSELLRQEVIKGRFEPLQLLPLSSTQRAWLWSAPNTQAGLLLCAAMLPAIAWGLGGGLFEWREAGLLIIVVTLSLWSTPSWAPTAWRVGGAKPAPTGKDALKMVGNNMAANNGGAKNKVGDGLVLPPDLAVNARGWGGGLGLTAPIWLMAQFGMAGVAIGVARAYWTGLPPHVRAASGEIWFNWPLFLVRWLGEAQPFFGFSLAPILLFLPFWLAGATIRVLRLAAVTGREQFWTDARFALWKRAQTVQGALGFAFLLGVLWPGAIEGAWLTNWFGKLAGTPVQALAAWWIICVAAGALSTTAMWRASLELPVGLLTLRAQLPRAIKLATRGWGVALAFWALACLLGWRSPFSALWLQILPASLAMAAVWIAAQCASHAAQRAPRWSNALAAWHFVWFYSGPICGALLLVLAQFPAKSLTAFYPFSPWTLWLMLRNPNVGANSIFWIACAIHATLAVITGALAWRLGRDRITATATANAQGNEATLDEITPQTPIANAPALPSASQTVSLTRRPLPAPDAWTARLLVWLSRFDNPLLTLEMRRAVSGNPRTFATSLLILQALVASVPLIILPLVNAATGYWADDAFVLFVGLMLAIPCAAMQAGTNGASLCYDRDRLDGTLELLFLTPRTSDEIAWGKAGPFIVRAALLGAVCLPIFLVGALMLPTAGQSLLSAAYAGVPLWICALTLRGIVGAHWMALKKRKIGATNVSFVISLGLLFMLLAEVGVILGAVYLGAPYVIAAALLLSAIYVVEAAWLWKRGVRELERWRLNGAPGAK